MSEFIIVTEYEEPYWQILVNTECIEKVTQRMYEDGPATYLCRRNGYAPLRIQENIGQVMALLAAPIGRPFMTTNGFGGYWGGAPAAPVPLTGRIEFGKA